MAGLDGITLKLLKASGIVWGWQPLIPRGSAQCGGCLGPISGIFGTSTVEIPHVVISCCELDADLFGR